MFASTLFADEADVRDFDLQIQNLLRTGRADEAAGIIETALGVLADGSHAVAALCLASPVEAVEIVGWDKLGSRIDGFDTASAPITALGIDISWPGHSGAEPDADGCLEPILETNFYTDSAFPFTAGNRTALLESYGTQGAEWQGRMAEIDNVLSVRGLGKVYGVIFPLVERITTTPDPVEADAMRLGAAFVAVRVHQAVDRAIRQDGLPRPLAVIVGSNESHPFYDAPVVSTDESLNFLPAPLDADSEELSSEIEVPEVLPVQTDVAGDSGPTLDLVADADKLVIQLSGASLRHRLGQQNAGEAQKPQRYAAGGILRRLFVRKAAVG